MGWFPQQPSLQAGYQASKNHTPQLHQGIPCPGCVQLGGPRSLRVLSGSTGSSVKLGTARWDLARSCSLTPRRCRGSAGLSRRTCLQKKKKASTSWTAPNPVSSQDDEHLGLCNSAVNWFLAACQTKLLHGMPPMKQVLHQTPTKLRSPVNHGLAKRTCFPQGATVMLGGTQSAQINH